MPECVVESYRLVFRSSSCFALEVAESNCELGLLTLSEGNADAENPMLSRFIFDPPHPTRPGILLYVLQCILPVHSIFGNKALVARCGCSEKPTGSLSLAPFVIGRNPPPENPVRCPSFGPC